MHRRMSPCIGRRFTNGSRLRSERAMRPGNLYGRNLLRGLWLLVRIPVLALLVILEPVVVLVLGGLALAGVLTTLFFVLIHAPHFPAWTIFFLSLGFGLA